MANTKLTEIMTSAYLPAISISIPSDADATADASHTQGVAITPARGGLSSIRNTALLLSLLFALTGDPGLAQRGSTKLSPSEAYKAAMAPLNAARAQPGDLTDADKFALGIGMADALRNCLALSADISAFTTDPKELLALSELCIFGQQYRPASATLEKYLALPEPPERKLALVLLVRALLGLNEPTSAEAEVRSLLRDYPYDAQIHFAVDQVIDGLEGEGLGLNRLALQLCATQNANTLPLLISGKAFEGKDINASPSVLFADAVRCVALSAELGKATTQDTLSELTAIAQQPGWTPTADLAPMQAALARQTAVGGKVPLSGLHGHLISNSTLLPRSISLEGGTTLLVPFTLWAPSAPDVVLDLARLAPHQPIYAITSWKANTGREDVPSREILMALNSWRQNLPRHVYMLIVPDIELRAFHADSFPSGIVVSGGVVRWNSVLSSRGEERMLVHALNDPARKP
jgi:hypothetical protein